MSKRTQSVQSERQVMAITIGRLRRRLVPAVKKATERMTSRVEQVKTGNVLVMRWEAAMMRRFHCGPTVVA